jgi:hypothetical protein
MKVRRTLGEAVLDKAVEFAPMVVEGARPLILDDPVARERDAEEYLVPIAAELRGRGVDAAWSGAAPRRPPSWPPRGLPAPTSSR